MAETEIKTAQEVLTEHLARVPGIVKAHKADLEAEGLREISPNVTTSDGEMVFDYHFIDTIIRIMGSRVFGGFTIEAYTPQGIRVEERGREFINY